MHVDLRVLGLDPGGTTGWSCYDAELGEVDNNVVEERLTVGHLADDKHEHHQELYDFLEDRMTHNFYLVCESFEFRNNEKHRDNISLISKEYIGIVKLFAQQREMPPGRIVFLTAGQSKGFIPDKAKNGLAANAKLKAMGWYNPGYKHANDATRVVAFHLVNNLGRTDLIRSWRSLV